MPHKDYYSSSPVTHYGVLELREAIGPSDLNFFILADLVLFHHRAAETLLQCARSGEHWRGIERLFSDCDVTQVGWGTDIIPLHLGRELLTINYGFMELESLSYLELFANMEFAHVYFLHEQVAAVGAVLKRRFPLQYEEVIEVLKRLEAYRLPSWGSGT
ncbi:MAG: hypothetical protein ABL962_01875 [Fimbriimonadaceae bacterium]